LAWIRINMRQDVATETGRLPSGLAERRFPVRRKIRKG
jgi:hypothetical protein